MALSGSIYSAVASQGWQLRLDWSASQSTSNNQTTVSMKLYVYNKYQSYNSGGTAYYTINGTKTTYTYSYGSTAGWNYCGSKSQTFKHNNDGTCSTTLSAEWCSGVSGSSWTPYSMNLSQSVTFNTIPRASSITSASDVTAGNNVSVKWTPNASSFTFKIRFTGGSPAYDSGWISVSPASTSAYTYTGLNLALATMANACRSASSFTMTASLATYSGSSQIGSTSTKSFTVTIPNNSTTKPKISTLTVTKADTVVPSNWGIYVQGQSKVTLTPTSTLYQNTSAKSYSFTGGGYTGKTSPYTTGVLNTAGTNTFSATVTDNRGFTSATKNESITVVEWSAPTLSNVLCLRSNSQGQEDDSGYYLRITGNSGYSSCADKNIATTKVYYKEYGDSTWIEIHSVATTNGAFAYTLGSGTTFDTEKSYDIKIEIADTFKTSSYQDVLSTAHYTMVLRHGGNGIAFGKSSELDAFECAFPMKLYENAELDMTNYQDDGAFYSVKANNHHIRLGIGSGGSNRGVYDAEKSNWIINRGTKTTSVVDWSSIGTEKRGVYFSSTGVATAMSHDSLLYWGTPASDNANNATESGFWHFNGSTTNAPITSPCNCFVMSISDTRTVQIACRDSSTTDAYIYKRTYYNGTWGKWYKYTGTAI